MFPQKHHSSPYNQTQKNSASGNESTRLAMQYLVKKQFGLTNIGNTKALGDEQNEKEGNSEGEGES